MIKTFIIAALTADGFIARDKNQAAVWTSREDKQRFVSLTKKAGVVVMGSRTYSTLPKPLKDRLNIVYSRTQSFPGAETTSKSPRELIAELETRGYKEAAICGGAEIYDMFMRASVVDSLYLTIEPVLFGDGIRLFTRSLDVNLSFVSSEKTESGALFLEYKIIR